MLYTGGYSIYCTVDPEVQSIVESVYADRNNLNYTSSKGELLQSGATIIDNTTGDIVAVAGRVGEREGRFLLDYSTVVRQCGSAIKPLSVYAPALDAGVITPASVIDDYPVEMLGGSIWPVNAYSGYRSIMTLQDAIRNSSNPTAVRTAIKLTLPSSYAFMTENLSFTTLTNDDMTAAGALALGGLSKGVTTREMAAAYATFARGGVYTTPRTYTEVLDHNGNVILENKTESHVAMKESTAYAMNELLKNVVRNGTGTGANFSGMTIAGKTGSTNSNNDRYFVGYTPYYTAAVWVGYDTPTRIVASGNPAATLWKTFMSKVHAGLPNKDFEVSSADMVSVTVCTQTGLLASAGCPSQTVKVAKELCALAELRRTHQRNRLRRFRHARLRLLPECYDGLCARSEPAERQQRLGLQARASHDAAERRASGNVSGTARRRAHFVDPCRRTGAHEQRHSAAIQRSDVQRHVHDAHNAAGAHAGPGCTG